MIAVWPALLIMLRGEGSTCDEVSHTEPDTVTVGAVVTPPEKTPHVE